MNEEEQGLNHDGIQAARALGTLFFVLNCHYRKNFGLQFFVANYDRTKCLCEKLQGLPQVADVELRNNQVIEIPQKVAEKARLEFLGDPILDMLFDCRQDA